MTEAEESYFKILKLECDLKAQAYNNAQLLKHIIPALAIGALGKPPEQREYIERRIKMIEIALNGETK